MESNPETITILSQCLCQSLNPDPSHRKLAEEQLEMAKQHLGFGNVLIVISQDTKAEPAARQAAALAFKNWIKNSWAPVRFLSTIPSIYHATHDAFFANLQEEGDDGQIASTDRDSLKSKLLSVLISLASTPSLLIQYSEAISIIATSDFPEQWPDLIDQIVRNFNPNDWNANNALLSTAHAIFKRWRAQFRTDRLFLEIKYVLERFCEPETTDPAHILQLLDTALANVAPTLPKSQQQILAKSLLFMIQIYYDLNCQDIPEYFEDHLQEFMSLLHKYLTWEIPYLLSDRQQEADDEEEGEAGDLEKIRASICEVVELYSLRYLDVFPMMDVFVKTCWDMLTRLGRQQRSDIVRLHAKRVSYYSYEYLIGEPIYSFSVKRRASYRWLSRCHLRKAFLKVWKLWKPFATKSYCPTCFCEVSSITHSILEGKLMELRRNVFVDFEVEMFEEDPAEQAAIEITRALIEQFQKEVTTIITRYVQNYLQVLLKSFLPLQYAADPAGNWRLKDAAVSLVASIASRSSTTSGGVTNINALVDVVLFFSEQVVQDLSVKNAATPHPVIAADAIKFLHTFRNQLTREQLISVLPLLVPHLNSEFSFPADIFLLSRFNLADLKELGLELLDGLFAQIRKGTTPQQIAQNEMLMKCMLLPSITDLNLPPFKIRRFQAPCELS
ncbi:hypothetical protein VP01_52g9 [Puccinia sorghi]|uniref:Importin N-terminal domain-containing protein n=1 Tax=Puccinia sorghi TaxID=27349 RepID=A0A0L6UMA1_9BASI|nr:hypothetical protein VP01_52g9 [Puccinia sorghi]